MSSDAPKLRPSPERGTSPLEMLLCVPIALLFLFVVIDGGLALIERSSLRDGLRAGLNFEAAVVAGQDAAGTIAEEILSNALRAAGVSDEDRRVAVEVRVLELAFDPLTGRLLSTGAVRETAREVRPAGGDALERASAAGYDYVTAEAFIEATLRHDADGPHPFAVPLGLRYRADRSESAAVHYQTPLTVLYAELRALPAGTNQRYTRSVLGRFYALQEQTVRIMRAPALD